MNEENNPPQAVQPEAKVGDFITFQLRATGKYHCHEIMSKNDDGTYSVFCHGEKLVITSEEIVTVFSR